MSNTQSNDSLRKLNAKLLAEIAELRKVNAKLKDKNAEIPDLKRKFTEIESEKVELKARIAKLLRQAVEESKRRDVENAELKARIEKLEKNKTVTTKLESKNADPSNFNLVAVQLSMVMHHEKPLVDKEMDTSLLPEELIPEVIAKQSVSAINISVMDQRDQTSLEDKETVAFLDEVHKKKISDEIRQRNKEKKLQAQESLPISPEEKRPQVLDLITHSASSEASANSDGRKVPSEEKIGSEQDSKCKKEKSVNKLKQELLASELSLQESSIEQNHVTEISETLCPRKVTSDRSSIDEASQHLAQLCNKAFDAEDKANRANQEEILCWCLYAKDFIIQLNGIIKSSGEVIDYEISLEKLPLVTDHMTEISETLCPRKNLPVNTTDQNNVLEVLFPKESTAPISLAHDSVPEGSSNSSDNSKEETNFEDEIPDNSDDDGYNRYGGYSGYNEYGKRDRGYYYCDGRYERKSFPMISPIISPVTA
ncbi:hypothetical protein C1645_833087 [Glomus cerebriforme]|uniref:Uncharacterized protein n=1 Tax=Glomus cerebriforme TaxID=658196 RepID=A0A397SG91_9GLOM|nr:hypothetical protein C1645_833087 [Glomus cerebriforme]